MSPPATTPETPAAAMATAHKRIPAQQRGKPLDDGEEREANLKARRRRPLGGNGCGRRLRYCHGNRNGRVCRLGRMGRVPQHAAWVFSRSMFSQGTIGLENSGLRHARSPPPRRSLSPATSRRADLSPRAFPAGCGPARHHFHHTLDSGPASPSLLDCSRGRQARYLQPQAS